jgi:hypothetical protein
MNPVSSAVITAYYSSTLSTGDVDGYCLVTCDLGAIDKVDVYYRILYHEVGTPPTTWVFHSDIPWERWYFGIKVKIGYLVSGGINYPVPVRTVDQIKIETHDLSDDIPANTASFIVNTPSSLAPTQVTPHDFDFVCGGDIGSLNGTLTLRWQDLTKFVSGGRVTMTKYGVTSQGSKQTLFDQNFSSMPLTFNPDYSSPNFIQIPFLLLPPGIQLPDPPIWSGNPPPSTDPNAPLWVVEGDLLTITLVTQNNSPNASAATITTTFNVYFYHTPRFYQFADAATINQPYRKQLEVIQDPWVPIPIEGTFAMSGPFPPGPVGAGAWNLSPSGLLTCTSPTAIGAYTLKVTVTNRGHGASQEPIYLAVNLVGKPVIMAPPPSLPLTRGLPFPAQYNLYATNHPFHWSWTGTLPSGISIDPNTGVISGVPDTVEVRNVTFFATNASFVSDGYATTWTVSSYDPPIITSPSTLTAYIEETAIYQITTNQQALSWRVFDLPGGANGGLKLLGSVITGRVNPSVLPGVYTVGIQAANRWGWSPLFQLQLTVAVAPPVIFSALAVTTEVDGQFDYDIVATHSPIAYGADPLPIGLSLNISSGHISGIPTQESADYLINLSALNPGGAGTAALHLTIVLPPVPVIDTTATHGRAITAETGVPFTFTAVASHNPTDWTAAGVPSGLSLFVVPNEHGRGTSARLSGQFEAGGLYGVSFVASNRGGDSAEAVFYFLVTISSVQAQEINKLGTVMEIWIDLNTAEVGIGNTLTIEDEIPVPPTGSALNLKRGDTIDLRIVFHEDGVPVDVDMSSMKFGIKEAFDDEFIIFTDTFSTVQGIGGGAGHFRINPDFSGTNDDLDAVLVDATTTLKGEIQWEMLDEQGVSIRRSSQIFDVVIFRDLIHPD